ncbi:bacteriohemerythrin [Clostridium hydrogeniformans]|uniref:bacteriohemerythrin n=1 Tax=Clostridium hydrogeniformans TaxID=349933 RepID=UPI0004854D37|nr:bacteriohemerythrin [Clostridium hydrogeniformans]
MFNWKEEYSVGVKAIDNQHKELFNLGNMIYNKIKSNNKDKMEDVKLIIKRLHEYTIYHFEYEESLMEKYNYRDYFQHQNSHKDFIDALDNMEDLDMLINQDKALVDMLNFVLEWITKHILKEDMQYKEFFLNKITG